MLIDKTNLLTFWIVRFITDLFARNDKWSRRSYDDDVWVFLNKSWFSTLGFTFREIHCYSCDGIVRFNWGTIFHSVLITFVVVIVWDWTFLKGCSPLLVGQRLNRCKFPKLIKTHLSARSITPRASSALSRAVLVSLRSHLHQYPTWNQVLLPGI